MREPFAEAGESGAGLLTAEAAHPGLTLPLWTDCHLCSIRACQARLRWHSPPAFRPDAHSCLSAAGVLRSGNLTVSLTCCFLGPSPPRPTSPHLLPCRAGQVND